MNTAELKYIAAGVAQFISDTKRAQKAEEEFATAAKRAEGEVGDAAKKAAVEVNAAALAKEKAAQKAAFALKALGTVTTGIFAAGFTMAVKKAMDFEDSLDQVGAVAQATAGDMEKLREEALRIGADTSFSAGQAASAMHELAAGGRSVAQIMGGEARAAVGLAEAGNYGLAESAKTVATAMDIWKNTTIDTTDVVNRIAGAANTSRFGVEDMSMAIAQGGGVAAQAGVDFADFSTVIAATASSFASGSDAGTSFKTFITSLSGSSDLAKEKIAELGLSFYDAQGAIRPMSEIVQQLHDKLGPLSQEQQTVALKTIFGNDAFRTAASLMQLTGEEYAAMSDEMRDTNAVDVAAQRMSNASGGMEQLRGSIESLMIAFGTQFIPMITKVLGFLTQLVNWFGKLPPLAQNITAIGAAALAVTPLILGWAASMKSAALALGLLSAASAGSGAAGAAGVAGAAGKAGGRGGLGVLGAAGALGSRAGVIGLAVGAGAIAADQIWNILPSKLTNDKSLTDTLIFWDEGITQAERLVRRADAIRKDIQGMNAEKQAERLTLMNEGGIDMLKTLADAVATNQNSPALDIFGGNTEERTAALKEQQETMAALIITQYDLIGGANAEGQALSDLGVVYGRVDADTRAIVDSQIDLRASLENTNHQAVTARQPVVDLIGEYENWTKANQQAIGPQMSLYDTMVMNRTAFENFLIPFRDAETQAVDWGRAIDTLNSRFASMNPELAAISAKTAAYRDELGEMERANLTVGDTFGMTKEQIEEQITALEKNATAYAGNLAVMEAVGHQITVMASAEGWAAINLALQTSTLSLEEQAEAAFAVSNGLSLIADGSLDEALVFFDDMKEKLKDQPELWDEIARVMGPEFIEAIASKIGDPALAQRLTDAANQTFDTAFRMVDVSDAEVAGAKIMDTLIAAISGPNMEQLVTSKTQETLSAIKNADNREDARTLANQLITWLTDTIPEGPNKQKTIDAVTEDLNSIVDSKPSQETVDTVVDNTVDPIVTGLEGSGAEITGGIDKALADGMAGAHVDTKKANELGAAIVDGIVAGLQSRQGNIAGALNPEIAGAITAGRTEAGAKSPSTKTRDLIGIPLVEGIIVGIEKMAPSMVRALVKAINAMDDEARMAMSGLLKAFEEGWSEGEAYGSGKALADGVLSPLFEELAKLGFYINEDASISRGTYDAGVAIGQNISEGIQQGLDWEYILAGISGLGTGDPTVRGTLQPGTGGRMPSILAEEMRLANFELAAMEEKLARVGTLLHNAGGESARIRDVTGEWFTWDDYRAMEEKVTAFKESLKTMPQEIVAAQQAWQMAQADMLQSLSVDLLANIETNTELTAEEFNQMFLQLKTVIEEADLPEELRAEAEAAVAEWQQALADGLGVANADVSALLLKLGVGLRTSAKAIGLDFADGLVDGIRGGFHVSTAQAIGDLQAFIEDVEAKTSVMTDQLTQWMLQLAQNLANGAEMSEDEIGSMLSEMSDMIIESNLPEEMKALAHEQILAWIEEFKSGSGIANADLIAWLDQLIATVKAKAAEATAAAAAAVAAIGVPTGGTAGAAPPGTGGRTSELDALAQRINAMTPAEQAAFMQTDEGRAAWGALMNAGYGASPQNGRTIFHAPPDPAVLAGPPPQIGESRETPIDPRYLQDPKRHPATKDTKTEYYWGNGVWKSEPPPTKANPSGTGVVVDEEAVANQEAYNRALAAANFDRSRVVQNPDGTFSVLPPASSGSGGGGGGSGGGIVTGFAHGTGWVPRDMLAYLHEGEAVIPEWLNRLIGGRGGLRQWIDRFLSLDHDWEERDSNWDWGDRRSWNTSFNQPMITIPESITNARQDAINFHPGSLIVNYSGPAEQARQVGEDFGEALMRTLRVSGSRV